MTYVAAKNPPLYVGGFTFLDERRPARTTGTMKWPLEGPGSRRNLIRCAGAILNTKYERERAAWRLVTPLLSGVDGQPILDP